MLSDGIDEVSEGTVFETPGPTVVDTPEKIREAEIGTQSADRQSRTWEDFQNRLGMRTLQNSECWRCGGYGHWIRDCTAALD